MTFPEDFVWGTATSSYQVEGGKTQHGRGPSVWDVFCELPGKVRGGDTGDVACDHVNRYREDVALLKQIGVGAYRLSIAWPRVMPEGVGAVSEAGLAFYDRLVDELLGAGIEPYVTLFHWDYPLELYRRGGWLNPASPDWFNEYTRAVVERLSDRVSRWITINEPQVFIGFGHGTGDHAPGLQLPFGDQIIVAHHVLKAHGMATQTIRDRARTKPEVGMAPVASVHIPASESEEDIRVARDLTFSINSDSLWNNTWFSEPVFEGRYPEDGLARFGHHLPTDWERDMELINQPQEFYGVNIYRGEVVRATKDGGHEVVRPHIGHPRSDFGWEITPDCLYWGPKFLYERYERPIIITENGMSNADWVALDGSVPDAQRSDFLSRHLLALKRAIDEGTVVRGYMHWSAFDNFEWAEGYHQRFGLIHVDFVTQKRTLKDSAFWYREVIRSRGAVLESAPAQAEGRPTGVNKS